MIALELPRYEKSVLAEQNARMEFLGQIAQRPEDEIIKQNSKLNELDQILQNAKPGSDTELHRETSTDFVGVSPELDVGVRGSLKVVEAVYPLRNQIREAFATVVRPMVEDMVFQKKDGWLGMSSDLAIVRGLFGELFRRRNGGAGAVVGTGEGRNGGKKGGGGAVPNPAPAERRFVRNALMNQQQQKNDAERRSTPAERIQVRWNIGTGTG